MSDSNPFGGDSNPFADPAIQRATEGAQITQKSLEEYNPFSQNNFQSKPAAIIPTNTTPTAASMASAQTYQPPAATPAIVKADPPPSYTQSSAQQLNLSQIEKQQQELDRRAAELDRREQMISSGGNIVKNFPPLPGWCPNPLKPCFYQDINREIPIEFQRWVRLLFYLWIFHTAALAFNIVAALVVFISGKNGATFGFSILFFILFTPLSYVCWFRPAYKGFRSDSSMNFMFFFFIFFCQVIVNVIEVVGFQGSGFCGLIIAISFTGTPYIVAVIVTWLMTIIFAVITVISIISLILIHRLYRNTGASFEKAQSEFASSVMSNKNVQNAAATVVTESARAAMQQPTSYGSPGRF